MYYMLLFNSVNYVLYCYVYVFLSKEYHFEIATKRRRYLVSLGQIT